jgi:hypothetical protein
MVGIPSIESELTGGLMIVIIATPSDPTSSIVLPLDIIFFLFYIDFFVAFLF